MRLVVEVKRDGWVFVYVCLRVLFIFNVVSEKLRDGLTFCLFAIIRGCFLCLFRCYCVCYVLFHITWVKITNGFHYEPQDCLFVFVSFVIAFVTFYFTSLGFKSRIG